MTRITFYITHHGFGHATREIEVINQLPQSVQVEIVTQVPRWLFERSINRPFDYVNLFHDPGVLQSDSLQQDLTRTRQVWKELLTHYPRQAEQESNRVLANNTRLLVGDISPFTVAVAQQARSFPPSSSPIQLGLDRTGISGNYTGISGND